MQQRPDSVTDIWLHKQGNGFNRVDSLIFHRVSILYQLIRNLSFFFVSGIFLRFKRDSSLFTGTLFPDILRPLSTKEDDKQLL